MKMRAALGSLIVGAMATGAFAEVETITGASYGVVGSSGVETHRVDVGQEKRVYVVTRPIVDPSVTVDRGLSEQPVRPWLIEVKLVNTKVYLDPEADYIRQGDGQIDENHSLVAAQRLGRSLRAQSVQTIYGRAARRPAVVIRPAMMLLRPPGLAPRGVPQDEKGMPIIPEPNKKPARQMASAE